VLPGPARFSREHIAGTRLEADLEYLARVSLAALEPQPAEAADGQADHRVEGRSIAVPADRRAWRVTLDEDLGKLLGIEAREPGVGVRAA
jgi:hypothetical protein